MKKSEIQKDQGLRLAVQRKNEAAERMTLPEGFTDRLMKSIDLQDRQPGRRRTWLYSTIGIAACSLLLFSVGIAINSRHSEKSDIVAQTDTTKTAPQTEIKKELPLKKEEMTDTVKKLKEILQMSRPPKHYMAKASPRSLRPAKASPRPLRLEGENGNSRLMAPPPVGGGREEAAWEAFAEERSRMEMEMMIQTSGSLQADFKGLTDEIRSRGERMSQHMVMALNEDE